MINSYPRNYKSHKQEETYGFLLHGIMDGVTLQDGNLDLLVNFAVLMGSCGSASVLMPHCTIISRLSVSQIADVTARVLTELVIGHKFQLIKLYGVLAAFLIL